jgi:hypothetical protein
MVFFFQFPVETEKYVIVSRTAPSLNKNFLTVCEIESAIF